MRFRLLVTAAVVAAPVSGCARPGDLPAGTPEPAVTVVRSATVVAPQASAHRPVAVPGVPVPARSGEASCARSARSLPSVDPSASFDVNDPRQRALRSLAEQYRPTPQRAALPKAAVPGAEWCVRVLRQTFALLGGVPGETAIKTALTSAGLTKIVVGPGPEFAASTGSACVYGGFTGDKLDFTIGPLAADRSCRL